MSKAKLTIEGSKEQILAQLGKLKVAGELAGVEIGEARKVGPVAKVEVSFKDAGALYRMGGLIAQITDADVKEHEALVAKEAAEKAKKEGGAKK